VRALPLMAKDLLQILKDWKSAVFLIAMPLTFTLFFGFVTAGNFQASRLKVGWIDEDAASEAEGLGQALFDLAALNPTLQVERLDAARAAKAEALVREGRFAAVARVPAGFAAAALGAAPLPLQILAQPAATEGRAASTALRSAATRVLGAARAAVLSADSAAVARPFPSAEARAQFVREQLGEALKAWGSPRVVLRSRTVAAVERAGGFLQSSPGMMVQFAIYSLITSAMTIVLERKSRALRRLLSTTLPRAAIVGGHLGAMFVVVFLQQALLAACGQWLFRVDYLHAPLATLLMMASLGVWAACLGLLIGALARSEQHVIIYSLAAMFILCSLGGAWFPLDVAGGTFARIGSFTPSAWAMEGLQNIVLRGLGLASVLRPALGLLACGAGFFVLAAWRFRFE